MAPNSPPQVSQKLSQGEPETSASASQGGRRSANNKSRATSKGAQFSETPEQRAMRLERRKQYDLAYRQRNRKTLATKALAYKRQKRDNKQAGSKPSSAPEPSSPSISDHEQSETRTPSPAPSPADDIYLDWIPPVAPLGIDGAEPRPLTCRDWLSEQHMLLTRVPLPKSEQEMSAADWGLHRLAVKAGYSQYERIQDEMIHRLLKAKEKLQTNIPEVQMDGIDDEDTGNQTN